MPKKRHSKLSRASAYYRLAAKFEKAGHYREANHYRAVADRLVAQYRRERERTANPKGT